MVIRALLAAGACVASLFIVAPPDASAADDGPAVQDFGACLAGGGQGRLLLVMDTSASLKETDPTAQRVEAAAYLVSTLSEFVEQSGATIDVSVAGFADTFEVTQEWTTLDGGSAGGILGDIESYTDRTDGFETDYWWAVSGGRRYLADHASDGDCAALVWMSDGQHDLDARTSEAERDRYGVDKPYGPDIELLSKDAEERLEAAGVTDLCRSGGVADALRVDGVTTLAIGLQAAGRESDFDLMRGVATGSRVGGRACGVQDATRLGEFALASQVGDLFFAFDKFADPDHAPLSQSTPLCQGSVCPEGTHQFVLDPSISGVRILAGGGIPSFYAVLTAPDGDKVTLRPRDRIRHSSAGFMATGSWLSDTVFSTRLERRRDEGWAGVWKLTFIDRESSGKGKARSNIRLYGDLEPSRVDDTALIVDEEPSLELGLVRSDGTVVEPSSIGGSVSVDAALVYRDGTVLPLVEDLGKTALAAPVQVNLAGASPGAAALRLTLTLTTAGVGAVPGTTLEPQAVDYPVVVQAPPDYPTVDSVLDFGKGDSADPVKAILAVDGEGCVWLGEVTTRTLPESVKSAALTSTSNDAESCAEGELALTLAPDAVGSGLLSGTVSVLSIPADLNGEPVATTVQYRYEMQRPANEAVRWSVFIALLVAGLLVPLLILAAVKWWSARIAGSGLSWLAVRGTVASGSSLLSDYEPDRAQIRTTSLEAGDRRRLVLTDRSVLRTRSRPFALLATADVIVEGRPFASSAGGSLPLAVQGHWIVVLDPSAPATGPVEIVFLLPTDTSGLAELVSAARAKVPAEVQRLRQSLGAASPAFAGPVDEWGAASPAQREGRGVDDDW